MRSLMAVISGTVYRFVFSQSSSQKVVSEIICSRGGIKYMYKIKCLPYLFPVDLLGPQLLGSLLRISLNFWLIAQNTQLH